ncbi:MAG TPA: AlpA family phage regulatory protein [Rhodoferax sp.]|jgi:predicted DNA-binding transcriptional regulator AlpA|nr:AlpA family phage regulatory protein [Rhodoferax sp.]
MDLTRKSLPIDGFIREDELLEFLAISAATLRRMVDDEVFPPPVPLYKRAVGWAVADVRKWFDSKKTGWEPS